MTTSNQVIINLSEKKIGTSFVFQLFRENFSSRNSKEIFVPGFKEYYFFPEQTENYKRLPEIIIEHAHTKSDTLNRDDIVFMLNILAYDRTGFTKNYFAFKDAFKGLENRDEKVAEMKKFITLCFERFRYLHRYAVKSHKSIYVSDTNFQNYILSSERNFQKLVIKTLNENTGPIKTFCVIRDPKTSIISLLQTNPASIKKISEYGIKKLVYRYNQFKRLKALLANCNSLISSILLIDFDYITNDTTNAFKLLCDFLGLSNDSNIAVPENPNPSKELSKEYQDDLSKWIPFIDKQINQQIDASEYKKLSEEKFLTISMKK